MEVKRAIRRGDVQSIHRAFDVLETVGAAGEMGTSELARDLGLAVSTVHSIVRTLAGRGYLVRGRNGYQLGPGVTVLASHWSALSSLSAMLNPALVQMSQVTGHASTATVLLGAEAQILGFEPAPGLVTARSGDRGPMHPFNLATGRLLVAMSPRPEWPAFIADGSKFEPEWSAADWQEELERVAAMAVCVVRARDTRGQVMTGVAVPVCGPSHSVICSIGCSMTGPTEVADLVHTLGALWEAGTTLSNLIGGEMPGPKPDLPPIR